MKIQFKYLVIAIGLLVFNCKNESKTTQLENTTITEAAKELSEDEKREIVKYYLINGKKMAEKDFHEIIFLNDFVDGVKIVFYEDRDAFFGMKFSEAFNYYNANKNK
jgi:hypothetical protein